MRIIFVRKLATLLLVLLLFSTCGELDTLFPSNGSYQVRTLVNGSSLEGCSIIRSNDKIRPYFVISVVNDQDLIGMVAYLQNSQGEIVGERVRYILEEYAAEPAPIEAEIPAEEAGEEENTGEEQTDEADNRDEEPPAEDAETESPGRRTWELPENGAIREKRSVTDTKPVEITPATEIVVKSLAQDLPYFPLPPKMEIGSYTLVFEALGKKETLSRTETEIFYVGGAEFNLKDISMYLPGPSGSQLISPGTTVMLEAKLDFDSRFDPYVIWYNGKKIISEGKTSEGAGKILWKAPEQAGFYSLRLEAFPFRLKRTLSGYTREIALPVSPKALSLGYFFENDPHYTGRSPLSAGISYPEQVQLITALLAALEDSEAAEDSDNPDDTEEQELPVMPSAPELLRWYQFEGSLRDSMSTVIDEQQRAFSALSALSGEEEPRWAAAGQSYGLSVEPDDTYSLSPINFFRDEQDQGGGIFLFHIRPPAEGEIFSVFFPSQSSETEGARIDIVKERNSIALRLSAGTALVEVPVYPDPAESQELIPVVVEFYIRPYRLEARLSIGEGYLRQDKAGSVKLPDALTGEGKITLGVQERHNTNLNESPGKPTTGFSLANLIHLPAKPKEENIPTPPAPDPLKSQPEEIITDIAGEIPVLEEQSDDVLPADETPIPVTEDQVNTVWDELAILFSSVPLLEEEIFAEADVEEQDVIPGGNESANNKPVNSEASELEAVTTAIPGSPILLKEEIPPPDSLSKDDTAVAEPENQRSAASPQEPSAGQSSVSEGFPPADTETGEAGEVEDSVPDTDDSIQEEENEIPLLASKL